MISRQAFGVRETLTEKAASLLEPTNDDGRLIHIPVDYYLLTKGFCIITVADSYPLSNLNAYNK